MSGRTVGSALPVRALVHVQPVDSVFLAAGRMAAVDCGSALVLADGAVVGIVTERDVLCKVVAMARDPVATAVESIMTRKPVCAHPEMTVVHALYMMKELGFRHFPVINANHEPLGVFSLRDAFPEELAGADDLTHLKDRITKTLG